MMDAVLVRNAERMTLFAVLSRDGIGLTFADGCRGVVPFTDLLEFGKPSDVHAVELPNPDEMILTTGCGERVDLSWDIVLPPLRPLPPADGRVDRPPGETDAGQTGPSFQGVGGADPGGLGQVRQQRARHPGQIGEWGADAPVPDA